MGISMSEFKSNFTIVGEIGEILVNILKESFLNCNDFVQKITQITIGSPDIEETPKNNVKPQIVLFLYHLDKNAHFEYPEDNYSKLALELYYLVIAVANEKAIEHKMIGRVAETFNANKVLYLNNEKYKDMHGFIGGGHDIKVNIASMTIDDRHKLWTGFPKLADKTFIPYIVRPVIITCEPPGSEERVREREFNILDKM